MREPTAAVRRARRGLITPPRFANKGRVDVSIGGTTTTVVPDAAGRTTFTVDLGAPASTPEFTPGQVSATRVATATLTTHAGDVASPTGDVDR